MLTVRPAFTLIELMVAVVLSGIVFYGIGIILADSQKGWHDMYNHVNSDVNTDSYVARKAFDAVIRKSCKNEGILLESAGAWVEVSYYSSIAATSVDRYARFYTDSGQLKVQRGIPDPRTTLTDTVICENVSSCVFKATGYSVQMMLTLDDGDSAATIISSAVMHN